MNNLTFISRTLAAGQAASLDFNVAGRAVFTLYPAEFPLFGESAADVLTKLEMLKADLLEMVDHRDLIGLAPTDRGPPEHFASGGVAKAWVGVYSLTVMQRKSARYLTSPDVLTSVLHEFT